MAQNKIINIQPVALTTTLTTNILNTNVTSLAGPVGVTVSQPYLILRHIRILNKTGTAATFSLYKGATAGNVAGTEIIGTAYSVAPNSAFDWYGILRLDSADFLVGGAGTTLALVFNADGEMGISG
ncbi:MAG: hypothetical protein ACHQ9S_18880 [Candidatus Binatia bacterium]